MPTFVPGVEIFTFVPGVEMPTFVPGVEIPFKTAGFTTCCWTAGPRRTDVEPSSAIDERTMSEPTTIKAPVRTPSQKYTNGD